MNKQSTNRVTPEMKEEIEETNKYLEWEKRQAKLIRKDAERTRKLAAELGADSGEENWVIECKRTHQQKLDTDDRSVETGGNF